MYEEQVVEQLYPAPQVQFEGLVALPASRRLLPFPQCREWERLGGSRCDLGSGFPSKESGDV